MSSNKRIQAWVRSLCASLPLFVLAGCSLYEGPATPAKRDFGKLRCLNSFKTQIEDYRNGRSSEADVSAMANCAVLAVQTFEDHTRGETRGVFTANEIRNFLERYLLDGETISDAFLEELMRIKRAFVGGSETEFSREDLKTATNFIQTAHEVFLRMRPHMPLSLDSSGRASFDEVDALAQALFESATHVTQRMTRKQTSYSFPEFERLIDEWMAAFMGTEGLEELRERLPLIQDLKALLISPYQDRARVTPEDLKTVLADGSRWAGLYLKLRNLKVNQPSILRGAGNERAGRLAQEAHTLLARVVDRHCPPKDRVKGAKNSETSCRESPGIPVQSLRSLIDKMDDAFFESIPFSKETLSVLIQPIVQRLLSPADASASIASEKRITHSHLDQLFSLVDETLDAYRFVEEVYAVNYGSSGFPGSFALPKSRLVGVDIESILARYSQRSGETPENARELLRQYERSMALTLGVGTRVAFDGENDLRPRSFLEASRYAWLLPVFKRIVQGYASKTDAGLTAEEFTLLIRDFWPVLVDMKLVGPKNSPEVDALKRFREASLFTQLSDGDAVISVAEGIQLILYMMSADPVSKDIHREASKICPTGDQDDFGKLTIDPECYRRTIYRFSPGPTSSRGLFNEFPLMGAFFASLSEEKKADFVRYAEEGSRKGGYGERRWFGSDDSQAFAMVLHYVEALFMQYDTNRDGFIDRREADAAFGNFKRILASMSGMDAEDAKLESIFYWILAHGLPPVGPDQKWWSRTWSSIEFLWWHRYKPDFKADRLNLLKVFATLSKPIAPPVKEGTSDDKSIDASIKG